MDVFFNRYCRVRNYNSLYICGTDEYGTATETKVSATLLLGLEKRIDEATTNLASKKKNCLNLVCYFLSNFYFSLNDSSFKTMKNVFYFI